MNLELESINLVKKALKNLDSGFQLPQAEVTHEWAEMESVLMEVSKKMQNNYPYFHPLYAGQMLKPPHPIARAAYQLAMWINPNNHAIDGSKASSPMEKEVVEDLAKMFGWQKHLGHLTSGGTMANLEALWVSGLEHPDKLVLASDQSHYTHHRICGVLKIQYESVPSDKSGRMDLQALEEKLKIGNVGTVVVTLGTTGLGMVDPLKEILELREKYNFRIHADAAYGGYFRIASNLDMSTANQFAHLAEVDSIVIDPHKHGLQPYGCGCVLFQDQGVGQHYLHDSPYTYFTSDELHLGEISLECSRAGATAVALWATHRLLPPKEGGNFAEGLENCRKAAISLAEKVKTEARFLLVAEPELDIVVWAMKDKASSKMSALADQFFQQATEHDLHLSKLKVPVSKFDMDGIDIDSEYITCIRCCLMKPEHKEWTDRIWSIIQNVLDNDR